MYRKNSLFGLLATMICCGMAAATIMSCSDDDKDDEKKDSLDALCHVMVSDDVLKVADVTVHYLDAKGQEATERMTTTEWKKQWTTTTLPARVAVWAQLKPKSAGGGVQLKDSYQLKAVATAGYQFHAAKGGEWADGWVNVADPTADPEKVAAADISGWCSKSAAVACEVDSKGKGKSVEADFGGNFYFFGNSFCMWLMTVFGLPEDNCVE
jgi:hypothetical protein